MRTWSPAALELPHIAPGEEGLPGMDGQDSIGKVGSTAFAEGAVWLAALPDWASARTATPLAVRATMNTVTRKPHRVVSRRGRTIGATPQRIN